MVGLFGERERVGLVGRIDCRGVESGEAGCGVRKSLA